MSTYLIAKMPNFCYFLVRSYLLSNRRLFSYLLAEFVIFLEFLLCRTDYKFSLDLSSNADPHLSSIWISYQRLSIESDQAALLQGLRDSKVFKVCTDFLDGKSTTKTIIRLF